MALLERVRAAFSDESFLFRLGFLTSVSLAPIAFFVATRVDILASIYVSLGMSGVAAFTLIRMHGLSKMAGKHAATTRDRDQIYNWLDRRFQHPAERKRLAVMAVSVELSDTFSQEQPSGMTPEVLTELTKRLSFDLREDDLIARGGLSDFIICLSRVRAPQTETLDRLARRLQITANKPIKVYGETFHPRLTIGVASVRLSTAATGSELVTAAEDAFEDAACLGSGSRVIANVPSTLPMEDGDLVSELSSALEDGQITAWYQPQLSTETGDVSGFEALARWEHPTRGVISPASFLPLIDRAGLSRKLAKVILTHALSALRTWDRAGLDVPGVGVNFAADELRDPNLAEFLRWELDRFDLEPSRLVVEVLESVISESHEDAVAQNLRAISSMGCRIDLDDFGTGFTSIINIRRFDVSRIKIDRKLVTGAATDHKQRDLIAALLSMSEHLHVDTLGEGVETNEEHLALAQLGCGHVQGFAIARPMPLGDTLAWTLEHRASIAHAQSLAVPPRNAR